MVDQDETPKIEIEGGGDPQEPRVLTPEASRFLARLHREFNPRREALLTARFENQRARDAGADLAFLGETREIREKEWTVAPPPADLRDRRVEITGPVDRKMIVNALNSGARVFMADFEDANSPTWSNVLSGQANLYDAIRRQVDFRSPEGKEYRLRDEVATLLVRPRGWHLREKHFKVDGEAVSASLFDFGLFFFHNARELATKGSGPYFYLPKLERYLEARLWNDVFRYAQEELGLPRGTVRATVLIETINAAFEMEEILWELRDHSSGLNAGRWDYIFSVIRVFRNRDFILPDRDQITMTVPFMEAYTELLIRTCHKRRAHAIGGMAAFVPNRSDPEVTEHALAKVREDKEREARAGSDGTWVAHPDLVPVAMEIFDRVLGDKPHQIDKLREDVDVAASGLTDFRVPGGRITEVGVRKNIGIALRYLQAWLAGRGAAAIDNLMEDAATAEISRAQLWQWRTHGVTLGDGREFDSNRYRELRREEVEQLGGTADRRLEEAVEILDQLVLDDDFTRFLTLSAYEKLD